MVLRSLVGGLTALSLLVAPVAASAAARHHLPVGAARPMSAPVYAEQVPAPYYGPSGFTTCVPMCPTDTLPCDPIYYKMADSRCVGRFH